MLLNHLDNEDLQQIQTDIVYLLNSVINRLIATDIDMSTPVSDEEVGSDKDLFNVALDLQTRLNVDLDTTYLDSTLYAIKTQTIFIEE